MSWNDKKEHSATRAAERITELILVGKESPDGFMALSQEALNFITAMEYVMTESPYHDAAIHIMRAKMELVRCINAMLYSGNPLFKKYTSINAEAKGDFKSNDEACQLMEEKIAAFEKLKAEKVEKAHKSVTDKLNTLLKGVIQ